MIIGEAISRVQSAYSKGMQSDDSRLSNRHIYSKLRSSRVRVISQQISKKQVVSSWCYQPIMVDMESVNKTECPEIVSDTCKVLKSKRPIPQIFTSLNRHLIQSVTSVDGSVGFGETSWETIRYNKGRKYAKEIPEFYLRGGHLYITNKKVLDRVSLTALFNDPVQAQRYSDSCGKVILQCGSNLDYDFAIDGKLEEAVISLAKDELVYDFSQFRDDRSNNASDDTGTAVQARRRQNSTDVNNQTDDQ